jgi:GT2 family glycosyltransferase
LVFPSAAVVVALARFGSNEAAALRDIASEARTFAAPVVAVAYGPVDGARVQACCDDAGVALVPGGPAASFGAAANLGARAVGGDVLVFIDGARPAKPGWLSLLIDALRQPAAGAAGSLVTIDGEREACGLIVCSAPANPRGFEFQVLAGARGRFECDALPSDCLVTVRPLFDSLGGFAETFGSDLESIDYCLRVAERGRRVILEPAASFERLAPSADREAGGPHGEAAFDARWRGRAEPHENYWPEYTGSILRTDFFRDGVLVERIAIPKVDILLHGAPASAALVAQLNAARLRSASATWADEAAAVHTARQMTEVRGPDYVAFVRTDSVLSPDWLNDLVNALERAPDSAAAIVAEPADARCTLVMPRRIPQHLRIEERGSFDASVAAWLDAITAAGRTIARVRRTATVVGPVASDLRAARPPVPPPAADVEPFASIVMLSWNAPEYTEIAVESIRARTRVPHEIIIVDNGSGPETLERLKRIPDIRVIYNAVNTGFAFGCNQGLAAARGTHIVLLNNDVVVTDGWLEALIAVQQRHPAVGCSAPRSNEVAGQQRLDVPYRDLAELPAFAAQRAVEHRGRWSHQSRVIGFCMCLNRRVVDEIGGLDPGYGTGNFEDDDYCMRIRAAGYDIAVCDDSFIHHFGSVTFRENHVDYSETFQRNMERFIQRWNVTFAGSAYDGRLPFRRGFVRERDFVPLPPALGVGPDWSSPREPA